MPSWRRASATGFDLIELWAIGQYVDGLVLGELRRHGLSGELLALLGHVGREGPRIGVWYVDTLDAWERVSDDPFSMIACGNMERWAAA